LLYPDDGEMLRPMRLVVIIGTLCSLVLCTATDASKPKPPMKRACQLATTAQVSSIMGRTMHKAADDPTGCAWRAGPNAEAALEIYGWKKLSDAKQVLKDNVRGYELCVDPPDHFLPHSGLGDDAWVDGCASNITFRLGRITAEVTTFTQDVQQGSSADTRRTAKLTRKIVAHLRKLRCGSFCRL
jgi:hypothetical protein